MLAVFAIPVLLGIGMLALLIDDDDDDTDQEERETVELDDDEQTFEGTDAPERVVGNALANELLGAGGDDILLGLGGGDAIDAGAGNDTVFAGAGGDFAVGGAGDDNVFLGDGSDVYISDESNRFDAGDDLVRGGAGDDLISDVRGSNELFGDLGDDVLLAADGLGDENFSEPVEFGTTDTLFGGAGNDTLAGDDGDIMTGGEGEDEFISINDVSRPQQSAVEITDFNPEEDVLTVLLTEPAIEGAEITFEFDEEDEAVNALYEGRTVAILRGLDMASLPSLSAAITSPEA